jgi:histone H3/H4
VAEPAPRRVVVPAVRRDPRLPREMLVVVSKLKAYVRAAAEMNTGDAVAEVLSEKLRDLCDRAIERARADGRKTVLERDFG